MINKKIDGESKEDNDLVIRKEDLIHSTIIKATSVYERRYDIQAWYKNKEKEYSSRFIIVAIVWRW